MSQDERLEFFRRALSLCEKWKRSPLVALVVRGQAQTVRQVMINLGEGAVPPSITRVEARIMEGEFGSLFSYEEILSGLSGTRPAARRGARPRGLGRARAVGATA